MSQLANQPDASSPAWKPGQVPAALQRRLSELRAALAGSLLLEGMAKLSLGVLAGLTLDFLLDYFLHMDWSQRMIMAVLMAGGLGYGIFRWILRPLSRQSSDDALVLSVEQKLGLQHNTLINTLQLAREAEKNRTYSAAMAKQVIESGLSDIDQVDFKRALNQSRSRQHRWWLTLGMAGLLILALMTVGTGLGRIWFSRNLLLGNEKWPTSTRLIIEGVDNGELVIPRGEDYLLTVQVDPDCAVTEVDVYLDFLGRSAGTRQKLRSDERQPLTHMTTLRSVSSEFQFRVLGGDYQSDPVRIRLVEPPGFEALQIKVVPPEYSGLPPQDLPLSTQNYKVLTGSRLLIQGQADVPQAELALTSQERRQDIELDDEGRFDFVLAGEALQTGSYRLELQDQDGVQSNRPIEFRLEVLEDQPPRIRTRVFGVTSVVMSKALVPIAVTLEDEFAVTDVKIEMQSGKAEEMAAEQFPVDSLADQFGQPEVAGDVMFDLRTRDIVAGTALSLEIQARDNQPADRELEQTTGKSKPMLFQVVTESEFRADLLRREMEQTRAFEKLISRQQQLLIELNVLLAAAPEPTETPEGFEARKAQLANKATREQNQIATIMVQITDRFRGFLQEVVYNRVDEGLAEEDAGQRIGDRLDQQIVQPLGEINAGSMPDLLRNMEWVLRSTGDENELARSLQETQAQMEQVLAEMKAVLNAMQRSQSFQELVNDLIAIKREEERLKKQAEAKKKEADSALEEIFD